MRFGLALVVILGLAVVVGVYAAHQQSPTTAAPAPTSTPLPAPVARPDTVYILPGGSGGTGVFAPQTVTVALGRKVTWINRDSEDHTATADNGAFNTDVIPPGGHATWKPKKPGTYTYSDYLHSNMQGTIIVAR